MQFIYLLCLLGHAILVAGFKVNNEPLENRPKIFKILEKGNEIELKSVEEAEVDSQDLVDFLQNNADIEYTQNTKNKNVNENVPYKNMKKEFVKRKVPHNYVTPDLKYDDKLKTYFRPLARFHKTKANANSDRSDVFEFKKVSKEELNEDNEIKNRIQKQNTLIKESDKVVEDEVVINLIKQLGSKISNNEQRSTNQNGLNIEDAVKKLDAMNKLAKFSKIPVQGNENLMFGASLILKQTYELYQDLSQIVEELYVSQGQLKNVIKKNAIDLDSAKLSDVELTAKLLNHINKLYVYVKDRPIKKEVSRIVDEISTNIAVLHRKLRYSVESYLRNRVGDEDVSKEDMFITKDGQITFSEHHSQEHTPPPAEFPKQHLWNYWTYPTGVVDPSQCPPSAVKLGNVCVRLPPH